MTKGLVGKIYRISEGSGDYRIPGSKGLGSKL